jgi:N-acetylglutamate synthase-like GNAT family acetyltransferase
MRTERSKDVVQDELSPATPWALGRRHAKASALIPSLPDRGSFLHQPKTRAAATRLDCLWISVSDDQAIGVLGVFQAAQHVAAITCFRVDPQWQHTAVVTRLLRELHRFCEKRDCLKVRVEVRAMPGWMFYTMERCGFIFSHRRQSVKKERWEFYLDLYRRPWDPLEKNFGVTRESQHKACRSENRRQQRSQHKSDAGSLAGSRDRERGSRRRGWGLPRQ